MSKKNITHYFQKINGEKENCSIGTTIQQVSVLEDVANISQNNCNNNNVPNDISQFKSKNILSDCLKYDVLTKAWQPDSNFKFPASGNRNLKFQHPWLRSFPWLTYSPSDDGVYCRYCFLFAPKLVGSSSSQATSDFVQNCFRNWKKAIEKFKEHQLNKYNLNSMEAAQEFINIFEGKRLDIACEIERGRVTQKQANREKLIPIVQTIIFLGSQRISLRGHRDDGPVSLEHSIDSEGNFRALPRFAVQQGNKVLGDHLRNGPANAMYLSHRIQDEIIKKAGDIYPVYTAV